MEQTHRKEGTLIYKLSKCPDGNRQNEKFGPYVGSVNLYKVSSDAYCATLDSHLMLYGRFAKLAKRDEKPVLDFLEELPSSANRNEYFQPRLSTFRIHVCYPFGEKAKIKCYTFMGTHLEDYDIKGLNDIIL
jgi:hypothetical protein